MRKERVSYKGHKVGDIVTLAVDQKVEYGRTVAKAGERVRLVQITPCTIVTRGMRYFFNAVKEGTVDRWENNQDALPIGERCRPFADEFTTKKVNAK